MTVHTKKSAGLTNASAWISFIAEQVKKHQLSSLGEVIHTFPDSGGFTAVHCLTESHISIHTWPEYDLCTCDVYLSNFKRDNKETVRQISKEIQAFLESETTELKELER